MIIFHFWSGQKQAFFSKFPLCLLLSHSANELIRVSETFNSTMKTNPVSLLDSLQSATSYMTTVKSTRIPNRVIAIKTYYKYKSTFFIYGQSYDVFCL